MITDLAASELSKRLRARDFSAREVTQAYLDRIRSFDEQLGCFLTVCEEKALEDADRAQNLLNSGEAKPLTGIPIALKDNLSTEGVRTTCASKILDNYVPPFDATVVERLKSAGLVILGKTNLDEFAMGTSTENSAFQLTKNPWDLSRSPGGSSGGSAAAVAARFSPLALGSDTGGSIRQPASLCGVTGFKPTYGRCSRYGLVAFGSSLDQIGPIANSVEDVTLLSEVITGHDSRDSTCLPTPPISAGAVRAGSFKGARFALPKELFSGNLEPGVLQVVHQSIEHLQKEGAIFSEVSLPSIELGVSTYYIIAPAEASSNLARFDGVRYGPRLEGDGHVGAVAKTRGKLFGHEVKARIMIGTYALSAGYYDAYYLKAQQVRGLMIQEFERVFTEYDAVLSPTSPCVAFPLGELSQDPLALKLLDYCTIPANMGGFPSISLNCGFSGGLPVGLQLVGPVMGDEKLLGMAYAIEQALPEARSKSPTLEA